MYKFKTTTKFDKDFKNNVVKRGWSIPSIDYVIDILLSEKSLPKKYKDHALTGNLTGYRDCHITPDWILIYRKDEKNKILIATRTGSHSDLY
jgi:mRNA interferase YafQ